MKDGTGVSHLPVNETRALALSTLWRCVNLLSDTFATLPFHVYVRSSEGKSKLQNTAVENLLRLRPNGYQKSYDFRVSVMAKRLLHGNFYAFIQRDNRYRPVALLPIDGRVVINKVDNELYYTFELDGKEYELIHQREIFHWKGYSSDGIYGKSVLTAHRDTLGIGLGAQKASKEFYDKGAKIDGILTTDNQLKAETVANIKRQFNAKIAEGERVPLLDNGFKFQQISLNPQDAEYINTQKFNELAIARIFGVPPHMVGIMDRATWNNVELLGIEFAKYTMLPLVESFEQEIKTKLFTEREIDSGHYPKFNLDGLMRADILTRYRVYQIAVRNGLKSANECRSLEDEDPYEGGDQYLVQGNNMVNVKNLENEQANAE